ncbi:MAG: DUF2508 family protein [Emergencia sp.]|nr:DUF2508 family protein [Emergencia sp.]
MILLKKEENVMLSYIKTARRDLELATNRFNELTDDAAIDYASYNLMAARAKYAYLMRLAKEEGLTV